MPRPSGPPTPDMQAKLDLVRWCVVGLYVTAVARIVTDEPLGALNDIFCAICGTFLLKDDTHLSRCYRCLHETPLGIFGEGGLQCLVPFMFMTGINSVFG